jgi:uncharacterized protein (UPF0548 family)
VTRELTYPEVGGTRLDVLPAGYRAISHRVPLGHGLELFRAASSDLVRWQVQLRAGVRVQPADAVCETGTEVVLAAGFGPFRVHAPCRVVWTVTEEHRVGFAYGTLEGHPESGEESFVVDRDAGGDVWFTIRAFSRPALWYSRLGAPAARLVQTAITTRYLRSLGGGS